MGDAAVSPLRIGHHTLENGVLLAPMTGVSDLPFRQLAHRLGAGLVVSEMVASAELVAERHDVLRRAEGRDLSPFVIQLVGCEAHWMARGRPHRRGEGRRHHRHQHGLPRARGDRQASGSALMRDLDHALRLIEAVIGAVRVPVTLKMRLGWDDAPATPPSSRAAPKQPASSSSPCTGARAISSSRAAPTGHSCAASKRPSAFRSSSTATS